MALFQVTAPATEPLSLVEAKVHLRVDVADEDGLIYDLIRAAREYVEAFTHRALITQTLDDKGDSFPHNYDPIELLKPPCASVTSVTYVNSAGATETWSPTLYTTDLPTGPQARMGRIVPAYQQYYPVTRDVANAVTVRFVAGYGTADAVPVGLKVAMKLLIGEWYRPARDMTNVWDKVLWPFKAF